MGRVLVCNITVAWACVAFSAVLYDDRALFGKRCCCQKRDFGDKGAKIRRRVGNNLAVCAVGDVTSCGNKQRQDKCSQNQVLALEAQVCEGKCRKHNNSGAYQSCQDRCPYGVDDEGSEVSVPEGFCIVAPLTTEMGRVCSCYMRTYSAGGFT